MTPPAAITVRNRPNHIPVAHCPLTRKKERMNRIDEELFLAAGANNVPEFRRLVTVGADVNATNSIGYTALIVASCRGHVQVVKELVEHGADIEAKDIQGCTPLLVASMFGHVTVVKELVEHGANIEAKDIQGDTPLHFACLNGHSVVVKALLSRGANDEAKGNFGDTLLHMASYNDHLPVVNALLSSGADILAVNHDGRLPIHYAVRGEHSAVSKYLLREFYATTRRLPLRDLLKDLTWIGDPDSSDAPPLRAALRQDVLGADDVVEILEYLVGQNPALLSSLDQDGTLPLHVACRRGAAFAIVQSLVNRYKASVKSVTSGGDLPLFLACEMSETSLDTIFILMKQYPDMIYQGSLENR
jgi:ankyrin repeat protein